MKDPEFVQLRNRFFLGVIISLAVAIPLIIFFYKSYANSDVLNLINKKETFTLLITSNNCDNCKLVKDALDSHDVDYKKINRDTTKDYDTIIQKLQIENKREVYPIVVYVEDGSMKANLLNISSSEMVGEFLTFHKLVN